MLSAPPVNHAQLQGIGRAEKVWAQKFSRIWVNAPRRKELRRAANHEYLKAIYAPPSLCKQRAPVGL